MEEVLDLLLVSSNTRRDCKLAIRVCACAPSMHHTGVIDGLRQ